MRIAQTLTAALCLTGFALIGHADAEQRPSQSVNPDAARAAAYTFFMRPPGPGKQYDTWADASGPDIGEVDADPDRLPPRVDNSERPEFPPVYRQIHGTCGQYTAAATMFTYEMNVLNGTAADSDERRFPATFSWNMMNRAEKTGSEAYHGWEVAKRVGLPTIKTYGTVEKKKVGAWPNGYPIWRDAMGHRVSGYRYTPAQTIEQLNEARGWLYDRNEPGANKPGGLFAMDGRMGKRDVIKKVTKTIPEGQHAQGEDLWTAWSATGYGHGMACAGYDDRVGYDLNGDGEVTNDRDINGDGRVTLADWERGAYIVVNSWGDQWSGDGKIYLLYSAMVDETWKRGRYLGRVEVAAYTPRLTLRFKMACNDRANLRMTVGLSGDTGADEPEHTTAPEAFNGWPVFGRSGPGHVPLAGPGDDTPLEAGIDLTPLLDAAGNNLGDQAAVFLSMDLSPAEGSDAQGELIEAGLRRYDAEGVLIDETPIPFDGGVFRDEGIQIKAIIDRPLGR
ncbi:MAG: hypothetical protein AAGC44_13800 [Planctomycetota bacterium]